MREELKAVMQEVRRNEALIEYMELKGMPSVSYTHLTLPTIYSV